MDQNDSKTAVGRLLENKSLLKRDATFFNTMIDKVNEKAGRWGKGEEKRVEDGW